MPSQSTPGPGAKLTKDLGSGAKLPEGLLEAIEEDDRKQAIASKMKQAAMKKSADVAMKKEMKKEKDNKLKEKEQVEKKEEEDNNKKKDEDKGVEGEKEKTEVSKAKMKGAPKMKSKKAATTTGAKGKKAVAEENNPEDAVADEGAGSDEDEEEDGEDIPNRGRDKVERADPAKNEERTISDADWSNKTAREQIADALKRENFADVCDVFRSLDSGKKTDEDPSRGSVLQQVPGGQDGGSYSSSSASSSSSKATIASSNTKMNKARTGPKVKFEIVGEYLEAYREKFPASEARNVVFQDASGEWDEKLENDKLEANKGDKEKKKKRYFMNFGIMSWRPYGKLSRLMREEHGKQLCMLLLACMEVETETADGKRPPPVKGQKEKVGLGHFVATSITLNKNGTSKMHVDDGNLGHSRGMAFGEFCGGETWVYDPSGPQWLDVPLGSPASTSVLATVYNAGWYAERDGLTPFVLRLKDDPEKKLITADRAWLQTDEGCRLKTTTKIQLPFKRVPVYHQVADFMGPWPHATAPAFPKSYVDPKNRPAILQKIDILGTMSPEEAEIAMQWAANNQECEDLIRYMAVFYPHTSATQKRIGDTSMKRAATYGFRRLVDPMYKIVLDGLDEDFRRQNTADGQGLSVLMVNGQKVETRGAKNNRKAETVKDQEQLIKDRTMRIIRERVLAEGKSEAQADLEVKKISANKKDYKFSGSTATRDHPLILLDDCWRDWGIPELVEKERQEKLAAKTTPEEKAKFPGKEAYWNQQQKFMREILRCFAGRTMPCWSDGKTIIPYRDWPQKWWWLKGTDLSAVKDAYLKHFDKRQIIKITNGKPSKPDVANYPRCRNQENVTDEFFTAFRLEAEQGIRDDVPDMESSQQKAVKQALREHKKLRAENKKKKEEQDKEKENDGDEDRDDGAEKTIKKESNKKPSSKAMKNPPMKKEQSSSSSSAAAGDFCKSKKEASSSATSSSSTTAMKKRGRGPAKNTSSTSAEEVQGEGPTEQGQASATSSDNAAQATNINATATGASNKMNKGPMKRSKAISNGNLYQPKLDLFFKNKAAQEPQQNEMEDAADTGDEKKDVEHEGEGEEEPSMKKQKKASSKE
ncbi:unnamed protein product [Amoebophrya sp. A25]|nr:unnamed protein product [Amoebophrya sp. A25]|eukprot:GSA25T00001644001.1